MAGNMRHIGTIIILYCICAYELANSGANKTVTVDVNFIQNLFQSQLEIMKGYTVTKCQIAGKEFNFTEAESAMDQCIETHLMPKISNRSQDHFAKLDRFLGKLPKMKSVVDFLPWVNETGPLCEIIPDLFDCFDNNGTFRRNDCWAGYIQIASNYIGNAIQRICESQDSIRRFLDPKNSDCIERFGNSIGECIRKSESKYQSPCGVVSCVEMAVGVCVTRPKSKVNDWLAAFLFRFQNLSGCAPKNYFYESVDADAMTPTLNSTNTPLIETIETEITISINESTTPANQIDLCTILEENLENIFNSNSGQFTEFFQHLDHICTDSKVTDICPSKSGWTSFVISQCKYLPEKNTSDLDGCLSEGFVTRIEELRSFCLTSELSEIKMGCDRLFDGSGYSSTKQILKPCAKDPVPAARKSENVEPLLWSLVLLPVAIFAISVSIHWLIRRKKKEVVIGDTESDQSLMSIDMKEGTSGSAGPSTTV